MTPTATENELRHEVIVDRAIAAAYRTHANARQALAEAKVRIVDAAIASLPWKEQRTAKMSYADAREAVEARIAAGETRSANMAYTLAPLLDGHTNAVIDLEEATEILNVAEAEYQGWSRFFLVQDGHIHSSMSCHTCRPTTQFGWLPDLSGLTDADAVAAHGPLLCTVCFPGAPVEWTIGVQKPAGCPGTGQYVPAENPGGYRRWARCPHCQEGVSLTPSGVLRKHKPKA